MIDSSTIAAVDAKLDELDRAFASVSISGLATLQDLTHGQSILAAADRTRSTLQLLHGDLYQAVMGNHVFPLDTGEQPDPEAALNVWVKLAGDAQETMSGVMGYVGKWGSMPGGFFNSIPNPLEWPWYVQVAAGVTILYVGVQVLGVAASAKTVFAGRRRRSRRSR